MKRSHRSSIMAIFCTMISGATLCLDATQASAQPWSPPCVSTKVGNPNACAADVTIATNIGNAAVSVPANATAIITPPAGASTLTGAVTQAGAIVPFAALPPGSLVPSPPAPAGTPAVSMAAGVTFGPPPGCCFDVYFTGGPGSGCYFWLIPSAGPCTP